MKQDLFAHKAQEYEANGQRVATVQGIGQHLLSAIALHGDMHLMDFGSGTGLLLEQLAPVVGKVTAVDVSAAMNQELERKRHRLPCELEILPLDLTAQPLDARLAGACFDGIVSSLTLHHVADVPALLARFYALLPPGGFIALADLDAEDGRFHSDMTGVFHAGFARDTLAQWVSQAGFTEIGFTTACVVQKPHGDYPVFLLTARRQES
ncbi:MAG: class I SAM-dependent methyltransferase [Aeromonadaceae bacterium]|nr:class I SAM-dependent methyltransferase [Aeromonadaceae bacterium]